MLSMYGVLCIAFSGETSAGQYWQMLPSLLGGLLFCWIGEGQSHVRTP